MVLNPTNTAAPKEDKEDKEEDTNEESAKEDTLPKPRASRASSRSTRKRPSEANVGA